MKKKFLSLLITVWAGTIFPQKNQLILQHGHLSPFFSALHPDNNFIATAGYDGKITVQDLQKAKIIYSNRSNGKAYTAITFNSFTKQVVTGSYDSVICYYDPITYAEKTKFNIGFIPTCMAMNPKFDVIAIGGNAGQIQVIDPDKDYLKAQATGMITGLAFSSNGALLFAAIENFGVKAYAVNGGKEMLSIPVKDATVTGMQLSKDDKTLLIHTSNGYSELVDVFSGKALGSTPQLKYKTKYGEDAMVKPALSADSKYLITVNEKNQLVVNEIATKVTLTYNNTFSESRLTDIRSDLNNEFIYIQAENGSSGMFYFNPTVFKNESSLLWRRLLYSPELIFNADFTEGESVALYGSGWYQFNLRTGDLFRRDNDSLKTGNSDYFVRYFVIDKKSDTYYYTNMVNHTGYKIIGNKQIPFLSFAYSKDTSTVAFCTDKTKIIIYNLETRKIVKEINSSNEDLNLFNGIMNDQFIYQQGKSLSFVNTSDGVAKSYALDRPEMIRYLSADEKLTVIAGVNDDWSLFAIDAKTGNKINLPSGIAAKRSPILAMSPDGKNLVLHEETALTVYEISSGIKKATYAVKEDQVFSVNYNKAGTRLLCTGLSGTTTLWNTQTHEKSCNILASPQDGMLVYTDENYYMATKEAARQVIVKRNNEFLSLENAEMEMNRPDKVLAKIGIADSRLIKAYEFAYNKRMQKIKLNQNAASPEITLTNSNSIQTKSTAKTVDLNFLIDGKGTELAKLNVWLNQVPLNGRSGYNISGTKDAKTVSVNLLSGTNHITYSALSANGTESDKQEIIVINPQVITPDVYVLTIGTSNYKDARYNLTYAAKDAQNVADLFKNANGKDHQFNKIYTHTIINENVTKENIAAATAFMKNAKPDDVFILFIAGHGVRDNEMVYYFGTHDLDFDDPAKRGFSENDLNTVLDNIKPVKRLIFFDTCLSGEVDKDEIQTVAEVKKTSDASIAFRNAGAGLRSKSIGLNNASALMREIYTDLNEGSGSNIISSAGGVELAMESKELQNGVFTYCLLQGIKNKKADQDKNNEITVHELQDYLRKEVYHLSGGAQNPSMKNENIWMNFRVW